MTIGAEVTVGNLIQIALTAVGVIYAWFDMRGRQIESEKRIDKLETGVRDANLRITAQQESFSLYQIQQARELATRESLREFDARIGASLTEVKNDVRDVRDEVGQVRERIDVLIDRPGR